MEQHLDDDQVDSEAALENGLLKINSCGIN
jgi:hypothetical protein